MRKQKKSPPWSNKVFVVVTLLPAVSFVLFYALLVPATLAANEDTALVVGTVVGTVTLIILPVLIVGASIWMILKRRLVWYAVLILLFNLAWLALVALGLTVGQSV